MRDIDVNRSFVNINHDLKIKYRITQKKRFPRQFMIFTFLTLTHSVLKTAVKSRGRSTIEFWMILSVICFSLVEMNIKITVNVSL